MRLDLSNETFSIGINSKFSPYTWCELNETTRSNPITCGIEGELLLTMQEYFNFSFIFTEIQNNYGFQQKDGSWTGMIGDLAKNKIDLGLGGTVLLYKRRQVVKYLYPHFYDIFTFATPPPELESNWDMLFEPFQDSVWLCLLVSFLLLFPLQRYLSTGNSSQVQQSDQHDDQQNEHHLFWICLHFLFLQQYPRLQWLNIGMKVFTIFWLFAMFVVATLYSGFLFSMMTIQIDNAIDSLDKLAQACRSKRVTVLANNNTFIMEYINNSNQESIQEILKSLQLVDDQQHAVKMILSQQEQANSLNTKWWRWWRSKPPQYVKVSSGERIHFTRLALTNKDSVYVPPMNGQSSFFPLLIAIPTSPLFKYHKPFDELISRLVCFGLLQHWRAQMVIEMKQYHHANIIIHETDVAADERDQSTASKENGQDVQLKLKHFESIFFLYSICIMFDSIMLFLETSARILINKRLWLWKIHDLPR